MTFGNDTKDDPNLLPIRNKDQSSVQSFATAASPGAYLENDDAQHHPRDNLKENNVPHVMATNGHDKKRSFGSASDLTPGSPSRLPRPASRASGGRASREPPTLRESLQYVADRNRLASQGSPSPAPRPHRQNSTSSEHRPLAHLFPEKPIELGRLASKRPKRDDSQAAKISFGPSSHNDGDTDEEFDRKLRKFEADDRVFEKLLKEERNGPFAKRKIIGSSIARPFSARGGAIRPLNGNRDGPLQVFAETGYGRQHTDMYHRLQQLEKDPEVLANHYNFLTGTDQGPTGKTYHQAEDMRARPPSDTRWMPPDDRPMRPATTAPAVSGSSWEVEDDFTGGDIQGSTSPPVSFERSNTRIDELRQREIEAKRQFPSPNKPLFLQRNNKKIDEIARLEKEVLMKFPVDNGESVPSPISNLHTSEEQAGDQVTNAVTKSRLEGVRDRVARERSFREQFSSATGDQRKDTHEAGLAGSKEAIEEENAINHRDGGKATNGYKQPVPIDDLPTIAQQEPTPPKEDSHDQLRRLARASSPNANPSRTQNEGENKPSLEENLETQPIPEGTVASEYKFLRAAKPSVGFTGISRSNSTNSIASRTSVMSGDPSARIAAEAKLFALDNNSERSSLRAPSPTPDDEIEDEADNKALNDREDTTPRPAKFADPPPAPTPVVTGAFIETPAPAKFSFDVEDNVKTSASMPKLPEKPVTRNRDLSTSPRASKSDGQREFGRQRSFNDLRRTKSASRHRTSPVTNTAKPPSAKDDLKEICQRNNIEDSELDDLTDRVLAAQSSAEILAILRPAFPSSDEETKELPIDDQVKRMKGMSENLKTGLAQIRNAKRGIERLEGQVSRPGNQTQAQIQDQSVDSAQNVQISAGLQQSENFVYLQLPIPKLYRRMPKLRLTLFGFFMLLFSLWQLYWVVEGLFYNEWGKQTVCYRGETCRWNTNDPEYGFVVPVKLDEWITGGVIRPRAARWLEEAQDGLADLEDWLTGTDLRNVHHQAIKDPTKKAQYWRRIEKKGLYPEWEPAPWLMPEIEEWDRQAEDRKAAEARAAMRYNVNNRHEPAHDSMDKDQHITGDETGDDMW